MDQDESQIPQNQIETEIGLYDDIGDDQLLAEDLERAMQSNTLQNVTSEELENVDLATDSLPAVDTPDACDKAAIRWVYRDIL